MWQKECVLPFGLSSFHSALLQHSCFCSYEHDCATDLSPLVPLSPPAAMQSVMFREANYGQVHKQLAICRTDQAVLLTAGGRILLCGEKGQDMSPLHWLSRTQWNDHQKQVSTSPNRPLFWTPVPLQVLHQARSTFCIAFILWLHITWWWMEDCFQHRPQTLAQLFSKH